MIRPTLENLPEVSLPEGYCIRSYQPGDHEHWTRICAAAFERTPEDFPFDRMMRKDVPFRPDRIFFACCGEEPVGTTAAWYTPAADPQALFAGPGRQDGVGAFCGVDAGGRKCAHASAVGW